MPRRLSLARTLALLVAAATPCATLSSQAVPRLVRLASASASLQAQVQIVESQRLDLHSTGKVEHVRRDADFDEYALTVSVRANVPWVLTVATPRAHTRPGGVLIEPASTAQVDVLAAADGVVARGTGPREVTVRWRTPSSAPRSTRTLAVDWPQLALTVDAPR
ncbi:MAG: hypothetical protein IT357_15875 [Gemmatimonadaceae bacterium]|nr:hypothetical protein [Gemmatimonadaceae bacterium]